MCGSGGSKLTGREGDSKVRSLLHDALEAVEDVRVERTAHGVLLEGRDRVLHDALLSRAAHVAPPAHLLLQTPCPFVEVSRDGRCGAKSYTEWRDRSSGV